MAMTQQELSDALNETLDAVSSYHSIFNKMVGIGRVNWTNSIPTAAVGLNEDKSIVFLWNPEYFESCNNQTRAFVMCHEILHVLYLHLYRWDKKDPERWNKAMDVVVNHTLVDEFGFNRKTINDSEKLCWIDTVFPPKTVETNKSAEYYVGKIPAQSQSKSKSGSGNTLDDHSGWDKIPVEDLKKALDKIAEELSYDEVKDLAKKMNRAAGSEAGSFIKSMGYTNVPLKERWESVIDKWILEHSGTEHKDVWTRKSRYSNLMPQNTRLPCEDVQIYGRNRIPIYLFLDTSGSCIHLAERFFKAYESIDKKRFHVTLCGFSTTAYKVEGSQLKDFGGTSFTCIEDFIQRDILNGVISRYPEKVFIITDGYGNRVSPAKPERWAWFLSENYRDCIPSESSVYMLADFE